MVDKEDIFRLALDRASNPLSMARPTTRVLRINKPGVLQESNSVAGIPSGSHPTHVWHRLGRMSTELHEFPNISSKIQC
jgi:hypothetical protein